MPEVVSAVLASAVVAAVVSALVTVLTQERQHRYEREEAMRARMLETADEIATATRSATGGIFDAWAWGAVTLRPDAKLDETIMAVRRARSDAQGELHRADGLRQRVLLLFGPDSEAALAAVKMVDGAFQVHAAAGMFIEAWETPGASQSSTEDAAKSVDQWLSEAWIRQKAFVQAAHLAMTTPIAGHD